MTPTTASSLRGQFRTAIEGITATYAEYQDQTWRYVPKPDEVPSTALRIFTILASPALAEDAEISVFGGGISYEYPMQVMASYSDLPIVEDESIIEEDARDLWLALCDVGDAGLIDVSFPTWTTDGVSEDGHVFGVFDFTVRYYGRNS